MATVQLEFEIVAEGLRFPEGPVALGDGSVLVVEMAGGVITRIRPDGGRQVVATPGGGPNGAAIGPDGKLYLCNNGGFSWLVQDGCYVPRATAADYDGGRIEVVDIATGKVERLYDTVDGHSLRGPNDLVIDAAGGIWFSDHGKVRDRDRDNGGLYYARADGSFIREAAYPINSPNGVGLSPDGRTVYCAVTFERHLLAFDIVGEGEVREEPLFPGRIAASTPGRQFLDSLAVTASGKVCVGCLMEEAGIVSLDPQTGEAVNYLFPDLLPTNICFGGPDMRDAWITLSHSGKLLKTRWPEPGLKLAFNA
jgi:gluconolactonase